MTQPTDELLIKISADVSGLVASLNKTNATVEQLAGKIGEKIERGVAFGFIKATIVVEAFKKAIDLVKSATFDMVKEQLRVIDSTAKMADKLGITTEALVAMKFGLRLGGIEAEEMAASVVKMQRALSEANNSTSRAAFALKVLKLELKDLKAESPDQQLAIIGQKIAAISDPSERAAVAIELLGKNGVQISQAFRDGKLTLEQYNEEVKKLGLGFSRVDAAKVDAANDAMEKAHMALEGIATQLAITSAPFLEVIANWFTEIAGSSGGFKNEVKTIFEVIVKGVAYANDALQGFAIMWAGVKVGVTELGNAIMTTMSAVTKVLGEVARFGLTVFTNMIDSIAQAFATMLRKFASGVALVNEEMAKSIAKFANEVSGTAAVASKIALDAINKTVDSVQQNVEAGAKSASDHAAAAHADLEKAMVRPIGHQNIIEWGQNIVAEATKRGQEIAAKIAEATAGGEYSNSPEASARKQGPAGGGQTVTIEQQEELEALRQKLQTETEIEIEEYNKRVALLDELKMLEPEREAELNAMETQVEEQHQLAMFQIKQKGLKAEDTLEKARRGAMVRGTKQMFGDLATLMNSHHRKAFEIGKAAAIAGATINGIEAAVAAWAAGMAVGGPYAPVVAAAYTAASLAATGAQISAISSQSFGGGGGGGGGGSAGAAASAAIPDIGGGSGAGSGTGGSGRNVSITLIGKSYDRGQIEELVDAINDAGDDGVKIRR